MSAADSLNPQQFIGVDELRSLRSADFPRETVGTMRKAWLRDASKERQWRHYEHGGPEGYVSHLAESIRQDGIHEPLIIATHTDPHGKVHPPMLWEGHHRALAGMQVGTEKYPVRYKTRADLEEGR